MSRVQADGRTLFAFFVRDVTARRQREREREELMREQAAREEAEQMASIVHGLQVLLDAALAHARLDDMLEALLPRLCEVLTRRGRVGAAARRGRVARGARLDAASCRTTRIRLAPTWARASPGGWRRPGSPSW